MSGDDTLHDQKIRDELGDENLLSKAAQQENQIASYSVIVYSARTLPTQYHNLIYSKWLRSLRYGNDYFKLIHSDDYYLTYHRYITQILLKPDAMVRLAVLTDDRDIVLGFSVTRGNILDYVHVHKDHRRHKIGTHLIPCGIDTITHVTKTALVIWGNKYGDWKFNPFL